MTTNQYSTTWRSDTNAGFQAWGSALSAAMQACGLSQTSDTGQINWSTVAVPTASNTSAGYEIYKFTDTLQSTDPVFIKIEYGTYIAGSTNGSPQIWITVGQGSNGSGTLTGTLTARVQTVNTYRSTSAVNDLTNPYQTYICFDGSYLGVCHKIAGLSTYNGANQATGAAFFVGRNCNASGTYVSGGINLITRTGGGVDGGPATFEMQCINTQTNTLYSATTGYFTLIPLSLTSTALSGGSNYQIFPCYGVAPQANPLPWLAYGLLSETNEGNTVSATIIGSTAQTYLMTGRATYGAGVPSTSAYALLMKYQ